MTGAPPSSRTSPFYTEEHEAFRAQVRRFVVKECEPNIERWEEACELPRELHKKAAEVGLIGIGYPEEFGGIPVPDHFFMIVSTEELARTGSGGLIAGLMTHGIACPPISAVGTREQ